jgi:solute carrier family 6 GABA transporter-like protein 1
MNVLRKIGAALAPPPPKSDDGRDQWPSRAAFLLAAMGGCAGQGNLLRYPSVVYNNYGLQWFIPYLLAVFLIAIPALILEVSIGQAYRGGTVIAFNNINGRLKGVGMGPVIVSFIVVQYFTYDGKNKRIFASANRSSVNLAWIMSYFRHSFSSPLPWEGRIEDFYWNDVLRVTNITEYTGSLTDDGKGVAAYTEYPGVSLIGETVGWSAFVWLLIWVSIFRGVGMTGRVVYFTACFFDRRRRSTLADSYRWDCQSSRLSYLWAARFHSQTPAKASNSYGPTSEVKNWHPEPCGRLR